MSATTVMNAVATVVQEETLPGTADNLQIAATIIEPPNGFSTERLPIVVITCPTSEEQDVSIGGKSQEVHEITIDYVDAPEAAVAMQDKVAEIRNWLETAKANLRKNRKLATLVANGHPHPTAAGFYSQAFSTRLVRTDMSEPVVEHNRVLLHGSLTLEVTDHYLTFKA